MRDHVWWKDMVSDVKAYCETCHTCKTSKPGNQKLYGLLNLLSVPTYPWESIGIDFVGPLPESGNRDGTYDSLTVVICLLTLLVHLSLLQIHIPNNDRLFPGCMDTQVVGEDTLDDEWAVDCIKSHSRAKTDTVFEILWRSGDVTWLPYYQITHLQALTDYLKLIGFHKSLNCLMVMGNLL